MMEKKNKTNKQEKKNSKVDTIHYDINSLKHNKMEQIVWGVDVQLCVYAQSTMLNISW